MLISNVIKRENYCIDKNASINDVTELMSKNNDGFIVFIEDKKPIGILTERDLVTYIISENDYSKKAYQYAQKNIITFQDTRTIDYIVSSLLEFEIRRVIVVDRKDNFVGVTTQEHLIKYLDADAFKTKMKLFDLNTLNPLISKEKNNSINSIFVCMKNNNIGSVIITDNNQPIGIVTERDIVQIISQNKQLDESVETIMSSPLITIDINATVEDTLLKMNKNNIQRIVVKQNNTFKVLGIRDIMQVVKGNYGTLIEKKLKQAKVILNSITEAILELYEIDGEYIIHWCNQKAFEIFNTKIIDKNISSIIDQKLLNKIFQSFTTNVDLQEEYKIKINDSFYKINCICDDIKSKESIKLILVDITNIEKLNIQLKNSVDEKTRSLQEINENLEKKILLAVEENKKIMQQLNKSEKMAAIGELIQNISHQWRQPLSVISTAATGLKLQEQMNALPPEGIEKSCDIINNSAQYLSKTIEEFKIFSRFEEDLTSFSIKDAIKTFLHLEDISIVNNNIKVIDNINEDIYLKGYKNEFTQCLMGMFNNSLEIMTNNNIQKKYIIITQEIRKKILS
ncbi:MAG: CBS domain-containing protein [Campylobacterota bacterium]|nr:CBS domain-containing protein [Campylobacterota bacterium]